MIMWIKRWGKVLIARSILSALAMYDLSEREREKERERLLSYM